MKLFALAIITVGIVGTQAGAQSIGAEIRVAGHVESGCRAVHSRGTIQLRCTAPLVRTESRRAGAAVRVVTIAPAA